MGNNKALLEYKGNSLVNHAKSLLKNVGVSQVYLSGKVEGYDGIPDIIPSKGPLGGIYSVMEGFDLMSPSGLTTLSPSGLPRGSQEVVRDPRVKPEENSKKLLFIPVDMPLLAPLLLKKLLDIKEFSDGAVFENHIFPLLIRRSDKLILLLKEALLSTGKGSLSLRKLLNKLDIKTLQLAASEEKLFANINTPEEYSELTS